MLQSIILGIVQGLTEFLPISSSAHLRIVPAFFGWDDPGAGFTAVVQLGTMLAELIYFRRDLIRIGTRWFQSLRNPELRSQLDARMGWYLIWATIPIGILGLLFQDSIETTFRALVLIGVHAHRAGPRAVVGGSAARRAIGRSPTSSSRTGSSWAPRRRWRSCRASRARARR